MPPSATDIPITKASGIPSRTLPSAIAAPLPRCSRSLACSVHSPHRLRCLAPRRARYQLVPLKIAAPASKANIANGPKPAETPSPMSSVATGDQHTAPEAHYRRNHAVRQPPEKCVRYNRPNQKSAARQQTPKASDHELRHHGSSPACSDASRLRPHSSRTKRASPTCSST